MCYSGKFKASLHSGLSFNVHTLVKVVQYEPLCHLKQINTKHKSTQMCQLLNHTAECVIYGLTTLFIKTDKYVRVYFLVKNLDPDIT